MKSFINVLKSMFVVALFFAATACSDSAEDDLITPPDLYKLGAFTDNGYTVEAYSEKPLSVGYNILYFEVHESHERTENLSLRFTPMMHMEEHSHASPFDNPADIRDETHGLYKAWTIFTMPGGTMGGWELQVTAELPGTDVSGVIGVDVESSNRVNTFIAEDESRYVLTLIEPADPKEGLNDLVIALHKRKSMMDYLPVVNASFQFGPWMPSMDHGSSNNEAPVHDRNGFYNGVVHFNMTGDWELRFDIVIEDEDLGHHRFELNFQD
jgi:hypothetical protein